MNKKLIVFLISVFIFQFSIEKMFGQAGTLDASFGTSGISNMNFGTSCSSTKSTLLSNGKIILVGSITNATTGADAAIVKYKKDGTLDNTFGINGTVTTDFGTQTDKANNVTIQSDGKILICGRIDPNTLNPKFFISRYDSLGNLDNSFAINGKIIDSMYTFNVIKVQTDGKIIAAGSKTYNINGIFNWRTDFFVSRYNSNGSIDNSFGTNGVVILNADTSNFFTDLEIQNDGKILACGKGNNPSNPINGNHRIFRLNSNGTIDNSFGTNGRITMPSGEGYLTDINLKNNSKIICAGGGHTNGFEIYQFNMNGSIDSTFGNNGKVFTSFNALDSPGMGVNIQQDGKIILGGYADAVYAIARYSANGVLDNTFGNAGKVTTPNTGNAQSCFLQTDGKIVLAGSSNSFLMTRYWAVPDSTACNFSYGINGMVVNFSRSNPCSSFLWDFGNGNTSSINPNPVVTYATPGSYSACLQCNDGFGCLQCKTISVPGNTSSIENQNIENQNFTMYPNPTKNMLKISNLNGHNFKYEIEDMMGKLIISGATSEISTEVNLSSTTNGLYYVKLFDSNNCQIQKLVIEE